VLIGKCYKHGSGMITVLSGRLIFVQVLEDRGETTFPDFPDATKKFGQLINLAMLSKLPLSGLVNIP